MDYLKATTKTLARGVCVSDDIFKSEALPLEPACSVVEDLIYLITCPQVYDL